MTTATAEVRDESDIQALKLRGIRLFHAKAWHEALECFNVVASVQPNDAEIQNYCARALEYLDRREDALTCLDRALAINPKNIADLRNRAVVLTKLGRPGDALPDYNAAISLAPDDADLYVRRAMALNQIDRREDALKDVDRAVSIAPNAPDILNSRVIILDNLGRYTDALSDIDRMLSIQPDHIDAINNSGMIFARLGQFQEALTCYNRSLSIKLDQAQAQYNRSLVRLAMGDWIRGFQEFEARWNTTPLNKARLTGLGPLWLGGDEDLSHKTILLYHEQGYGDTLLCVRYIPLLKERGARVILAVPPALASLMHSAHGVSAVVAGNQPLPAHHYQCPLMSLPLAFRTTPDTIPALVPYLKAESSRVYDWSRRLGSRTRPRIGLAWSGRRYAPINYPRDVPLSALRPLLSLDADFISLQKDVASFDQAVLDRLPHVRQFGESLDDFSDTAALIENLDLVICVDSAVAHLAGALGKPIWLMNRYASCWRWLQAGHDAGWYPNMRQFRQSTVGDWTSVVSRICDAVQAWLADPDAPQERLSAAPTRLSVGRKARQVDAKIRFVSATRLSKDQFFAKAALGRSLPVYRTFPKRQHIELRLFADNQQGLSAIYNIAIEEAKADPAILIFIHDDVFLSDYYWAEHLLEALTHFDLVGLAGNRRRVPRQASWMYLDEQFTRDNYDNLSGVIGHGQPFPDLKQLSVYGEPGQEVKLLDGVMLAIRSETLIEKDLQFDSRFKFHFYDMDFCRQAEAKGLRMGTWAISLVHASAGVLGVESWRSAYRDYLAKYGEA